MENDTDLVEAARGHLVERLRRAEEDAALHRRGLEDADGRAARLRRALEGWDGALADLAPGPLPPAATPGRGLALVPPPREPARGTLRQRALELLGTEPSRRWKAEEVARPLDSTRRNVRNALEALVRKGLAERFPDATYRVMSAAPAAKGDGMRERVLDVLRGNSQQTWWRASQVAGRLDGADADTVREHLRRLAADGELEKNGDRRYRLPPQAGAREPAM